jgi:hypothetical protein
VTGDEVIEQLPTNQEWLGVPVRSVIIIVKMFPSTLLQLGRIDLRGKPSPINESPRSTVPAKTSSYDDEQDIATLISTSADWVSRFQQDETIVRTLWRDWTGMRIYMSYVLEFWRNAVLRFKSGSPDRQAIINFRDNWPLRIPVPDPGTTIMELIRSRGEFVRDVYEWSPTDSSAVVSGITSDYEDFQRTLESADDSMGEFVTSDIGEFGDLSSQTEFFA